MSNFIKIILVPLVIAIIALLDTLKAQSNLSPHLIALAISSIIIYRSNRMLKKASIMTTIFTSAILIFSFIISFFIGLLIFPFSTGNTMSSIADGYLIYGVALINLVLMLLIHITMIYIKSRSNYENLG